MSLSVKIASLILGATGIESLIAKAVGERVDAACAKAVAEAPAKYTFDDAIAELKDPVYKHSIALQLLEHHVGHEKAVELAQLAETLDKDTSKSWMQRRSVLLAAVKESGLAKSKANLAVELAVFLAK